MGRPPKPANTAKRERFFGEWHPLVLPLLVLMLGLVCLTMFYASVLAAAHVVAADNGGSHEQLKQVTLWVCGLLVMQGLVPLLRFSMNDLPRIMADGIRLKASDVGIFVLLLMAGALLLLG